MSAPRVRNSRARSSPRDAVMVEPSRANIKTISQRWEAAAARYDAEKPRIAAAARNAPSLTGQARHAMPDDFTRPSYGATAARPQPAEPYRSGDRPDYPTGTGI